MQKECWFVCFLFLLFLFYSFFILNSYFFPSKFLHTNKVIHRDLKTDNVLLVSLSEKSPIRGKISDFGTSRMVGTSDQQKMTAAVGTPNFIAPEVIGECSKAFYSLPSDVYSFAVV